MDLLDDLTYRDYVYQVTDLDALTERLSKGPTTLYAGFDPTADSLHVGNLIPVLGLRRFQLAGHRPIALIGGGTGLIGDPSGKVEERALNTQEVVASYTESQAKQLQRFLDFDDGPNAAIAVSNHTWLSELKTIEFLRDVGKHFSMGYMLAKESVASRLEVGISFTEFSYMVLQAYDFYELIQTHDCELQIGGSDQWGNITAGIELIRRKLERQAFGLTFPLLEKSDGTKFGKSESGTVWLDPEKTTPYQFYQFWINASDDDVIRFLKFFTFLTREEIESLAAELQERPEKREAQRVLAREVTTLVHDKAATERAEHISQALFYGNLGELSEQEIEEGFSDVPSFEVKGQPEMGLIDLLTTAGVAGSKRQAREDVKNGAIYINGERDTDLARALKASDGLCGKYLVIRRGKQKYTLVKWMA